MELRLKDSTPCIVPFLVTESQIEQPIIGFNVISHILKLSDAPSITESLRMDPEVTSAFLSVMRSIEEDPASLAIVRLDKPLCVPPKCYQ